MTRSHFDVIKEVMRAHAGSSWAIAAADEMVTALRTAGFIIVRHDAIRLAQAHAREDADKPKIPPGRLWHEARGNIGVAS